MRYIVLKEFLKFKFAFFAFLLTLIFLLAWIYFDIRAGFDKFGASGYIMQVLFKKAFSFNGLDLLNIAFAILIAASSMFFERMQARIRVQFHYPHSYLQNVFILTLTPLCFLLVCFGVENLVVFWIFYAYFPVEIASALISTLIYSCAFSVGAFFLTQAITIEPNLRKVIANVLALVGCSYLYYKFNPDVGSSSFYYLNEILWIYVGVFLVFAISLLALALNNYKKGYIK